MHSIEVLKEALISGLGRSCLSLLAEDLLDQGPVSELVRGFHGPVDVRENLSDLFLNLGIEGGTLSIAV